MDVICKPKYNVIFWRNPGEEEWNCEDLDEIIESYQCEPFTELRYIAPVHRENSDEILYHIFECSECEKTILTVDVNHGYEFCPHCGRAIWREK